MSKVFVTGCAGLLGAGIVNLFTYMTGYDGAFTGDSDIDELLYDIYNQLVAAQPDLAFSLINEEKNQRNSQTSSARIPRNAKCPCGSGKKYKKCFFKIIDIISRHSTSSII